MTENKSKSTAGYQIFSLAQSARAKGMWAGALERTSIPNLYGVHEVLPSDELHSDEVQSRYEICEIKRDHTPAILKIIDEGLVNASDHKKEHEGDSKAVDRVSKISLNFDVVTGRFIIENDGPGIPIVRHEEATAAAGHDVYVPEVAFAMFLAGRNMEKPPDSVKGGINGIGAKLINVHSTFFAIETVTDGKFYIQVFRDRMRIREDPKIFSMNSAEARKLIPDRKKPHTRITFIPAYGELGYTAGTTGPLSAQDATDLEAWCRWRMFLLAAYVGPKVAVVFNGNHCPITSAKALAILATAHDPEAIVMECTAKATEVPYSSHPWDIVVTVVPSSKRFNHISVINGVHCAKGSHITYLKKILNDAVGAKLARTTKAKDKKTLVADTCKQVFLVAVGALPGADWGGQRKDELQVAEAKLRPYTIATATLGRIARTVADNLLQTSEKGVRGRKKRVEVDKYTRARKAGGKDSAVCELLAAEGDSAITLLRAGLTLGPEKNPGGPSFETFGIMSLGGVIMNAMKKVTEVETTGGDTIVVRSEQLRNNKVLKALVEILGLDFTCRYETPAEVARLRYGSVLICTDQDLDGTGKILPLVLVWFHVFWPNLITHGYVKRFMTPVIRAYPKGNGGLYEFFYENEFECWVKTQGGGEIIGRSFNVKYYKGLATHDDNEVAMMFRCFTKSVYTFTLDDTAAELFDVYFGNRPSLRKVALSTPVAYLSYEETQEIHHSRLIPCSVQLRVDAKAYKLDDIQRKIPGLDGIPVARRKVLAGALKRFANNNREIKVFQLGGYIAEHMFYHHGDASLNGTIVKMAQRFPGALQFPYLSGIGQYGSRHFGGDDAGSPRYINVRLASRYTKAMFPSEDTWVLPHVFEDGERAQPQYFVPVLPVALLESFEIPSEGWRHKSFSRDLNDVLTMTRAYAGVGDPTDVILMARIAAATETAKAGTKIDCLDLPTVDIMTFLKRFPLNVSLRGYGEHLDPEERAELVRPYKGYLHSFGWYWPKHTDGTTVLHITELPLRKTTQSFLKELEKSSRAKYIDEVDDYSSDTKVDVRIKLLSGAWDEICQIFGSQEVDPLEDFLLLRTSLKPFLNYYGRDGGVIEFDDDYHAVFFYWAPIRRNLYRQRLDREAVLLSLKIDLEYQIVRYIDIARELDLVNRANEEAASTALTEQKFPKFDSGLLYAPRYMPTAEIKHLVTTGVNVSHNYILSLRERDLVQSAKAQRKKQICDMECRLTEVQCLLDEQPFAGASVWIAEIEEVATAIAYGEKTHWRF